LRTRRDRGGHPCTGAAGWSGHSRGPGVPSRRHGLFRAGPGSSRKFCGRAAPPGRPAKSALPTRNAVAAAQRPSPGIWYQVEYGWPARVCPLPAAAPGPWCVVRWSAARTRSRRRRRDGSNGIAQRSTVASGGGSFRGRPLRISSGGPRPPIPASQAEPSPESPRPRCQATAIAAGLTGISRKFQVAQSRSTVRAAGLRRRRRGHRKLPLPHHRLGSPALCPARFSAQPQAPFWTVAGALCGHHVTGISLWRRTDSTTMLP
jgi:hypothetical protein